MSATTKEYLRLRQVCLVAPTLEPSVGDIAAIMGLAICYRDPNVGAYGLENALLPVGTTLLEMVAPVEENTAAGRFLGKIGDHGGYMAIFSCDDPTRYRRHAESIGVRTAHVIDRPTFFGIQLHPRDCRAAFLDFNHMIGTADEPAGAYAPAGPDWQKSIRTDRTQALTGLELESPDPAGLAKHWANIIQVPLKEGGVPEFSVGDAKFRFVRGKSEVLGGLDFKVANKKTVLDAARAKGYEVKDDSFHIGGVNFRVH
jgi:hypothetical protein